MAGCARNGSDRRHEDDQEEGEPPHRTSVGSFDAPSWSTDHGVADQCALCGVQYWSYSAMTISSGSIEHAGHFGSRRIL